MSILLGLSLRNDPTGLALCDNHDNEYLLMSGWYGDLEEANEGLLLNVPALSNQHEYCSERAGMTMVSGRFVYLYIRFNWFCSLNCRVRYRPSPSYAICCWSSVTKWWLLGENTWSLWSSHQTCLYRQSCSASFWIRCLLTRMMTVTAQVRLQLFIQSERGPCALFGSLFSFRWTARWWS